MLSALPPPHTCLPSIGFSAREAHTLWFYCGVGWDPKVGFPNFKEKWSGSLNSLNNTGNGEIGEKRGKKERKKVRRWKKRNSVFVLFLFLSLSWSSPGSSVFGLQGLFFVTVHTWEHSMICISSGYISVKVPMYVCVRVCVHARAFVFGCLFMCVCVRACVCVGWEGGGVGGHVL